MSKPSSKLSAALGKLLSLLFLVSTMVDFTEAFDWQPGSNGQVMWAMNCDFSGNDFDHVTSIGDVCGDLCVANEQCTHFTWANGICNLKAFINDAIATDLNGAVCGWVDHRGEGGGGDGNSTTFIFNGPGANAGIVLDGGWNSNLPTVGVRVSGSTVQMDYDNTGGARVYMTTANGQQYQNLRMLNRELTFTVDTSRISCSYNGALYFIDMSSVINQAPNGDGYCDAGGSAKPCHELDIWEANNVASVFTVHSPYDNAGCGYFINSAGNFYGPNNVLNTNQPFDIVTRFRTNNGDAGTLTSIERIYRQNGVQVGPMQTLNDGYCAGGGTSMSQMSDGMKNGMTLSLSLWGGPRCPGCNEWLDCGSHGPCQPGQVSPGSGGSVTFSNIRFGPIGST